MPTQTIVKPILGAVSVSGYGPTVIYPKKNGKKKAIHTCDTFETHIKKSKLTNKDKLIKLAEYKIKILKEKSFKTHQDKKHLSKSIPSLITHKTLPKDFLKRLGEDFISLIQTASKDLNLASIDYSNSALCLARILQIFGESENSIQDCEPVMFLFININPTIRSLIFENRRDAPPEHDLISTKELLQSNENRHIKPLVNFLNQVDPKTKNTHLEFIHQSIWHVITNSLHKMLKLEQEEYALDQKIDALEKANNSYKNQEPAFWRLINSKKSSLEKAFKEVEI